MVEPAWRRVTDLESFVPAGVAIGVAIVLQATLPTAWRHLRWIFVALSSRSW